MFKRLHLSLRFLVPLIAAMLALAYAAVPLVDTLTLRWFVRDLDSRSFLIGETLGESLIEQVRNNQWPRVDAMFDRAIRDERIYAVGICSPQGKLLRQGGVLPPTVVCSDAARLAGHPGEVRNLTTGPVHLSATELRTPDGVIGTLLIVHDMSFVTRRSEDTRKYVLLMFTALGVVVALITVVVAHLSWRGWVNGVRAMLSGEGVFRPFGQSPPELRPLVSDLRALLRDVHAERRMQDDSTMQWAPETLRRLLREQLSDDEVIVVSNREPYIHVHTASGVQVQRPASGLVTAVEPVMRACSGTWIAHGSGSADRETSGRDGRIKVPPSDPAYTLRRIWLTKEEEQGYYYGFANEGLWPLCHIAHVRPVFRSEDWLRYQQVNRRFADAVVAEADTDNPVVLVQDYHFALLPALVRERLPRATIITFWHIPWPNPESFGICPWREEILQGLLGSTIVGFHTRYHGNNFLQTVDRFLEARIENESSTVHAKGHLTQVESYPISIAWPPPQPVQADIAICRQSVRSRFSLDPDHRIALGVDRLDYTKGITERLRAVERLFELHPEWIGRFTFVQIAAPSRSSLDEYQRLESEVRTLAASINATHGYAGYQPIQLLLKHHNAEQIHEYYRACEVCMVTSLHDGMNLVAKEFIAARDDEQGVLILSQFAGAARELHEALIVNPYYTEEVAEALHRALQMSPQERRERMRSLRRMVREFNVYRWAARMLMDAARLRRRERVAARIEVHNA
ncbi:MAG TPA: trehalose-6-phosphate synthase [Burkholderiaceae bacterium]|nr:trehalose-6-phosphate synthase [Burkholderiaceae bacterium]